MNNLRTRLTAVAVVMVLAVPLTAKALMIALPSGPQKAAKADLIVVGKTGAVDAKTIKAEMYKGDDREMNTVTMTVSESVFGKAKTVKVAYFAPAKPMVGGGKIGRPIRPGLGRGMLQVPANSEGMLFLTKHPTQKDVYVASQFGDWVGKDDGNFATELTEAKKAAKVLAGPSKALASKDAEERLTAAFMLVTRYKSPRGGDATTEAVPASESKAILTALANADWNARGGPRFGAPNAQQAFGMLGLTPTDGFNFTGGDYNAEAKKWLAANAATYKMKRFKGTGLGSGDITEPE